MRALLLSLVAITSPLAPSTYNMCHRAEAPDQNPIEEKCLATMIYGEARGETLSGQVAVAYTAKNRAANRSLCQVVLAPKQYSIFNGNPALRAAAMSLHIDPIQKNAIDTASWEQAVYVARIVMKGGTPDPTNGSTHYLAPKLMAAKKYKYPKWSKQYRLTAVIDNHKFYKKAEMVINKT